MIDTTMDYQQLESEHGAGVYGLRGITWVRGAGATIWDAAGRAYVDCTAAYGVASLGHCHPPWPRQSGCRQRR